MKTAAGIQNSGVTKGGKFSLSSMDLPFSPFPSVQINEMAAFQGLEGVHCMPLHS